MEGGGRRRRISKYERERVKRGEEVIDEIIEEVNSSWRGGGEVVTESFAIGPSKKVNKA